jgi:hypothetical protein
MFHQSAIRYRPVLRSVTSLICLALPLLACRGEAQSKASSEAAKPVATQRIPEYRLTAPMVRKVSSVMREWGPVGGLGALMFGGDLGMSKEEFEALPDSTQERIMVENMNRAEAKEKEGRKQIEQLLVGKLADRTAAAERMPALKAALAKAGLSASEFVQAFDAYNTAMNHVLTEENFPEAVRPLEPGVRKDNVDLIRPMEKSENLWSYLGG